MKYYPESPPREHGTAIGLAQHDLHRETPCQACADAPPVDPKVRSAARRRADIEELRREEAEADHFKNGPDL